MASRRFFGVRAAGFAVGLAALGAVAGAPPRASADGWDDPVSVAIARAAAARRSTGLDDASWVSTRRDEVTMGAGLARVDVDLAISNRDAGSLEWHRTVDVDPAADLVGAVYTRADGSTTRAMTLESREVERLYGRATRPRTGRDPMRIDRPSRDRLDIRVFPVPAGATVRLGLSFATPLSGEGDARVYRDPLRVRAQGAADDDREPPVTTPGSPVPVALAVPTFRFRPASVLFRLSGLIPGRFADGVSAEPTKDGLLLSPPEGEELPPVELHAPRGTPAALAFTAGGYPLFSDAFVWRADPAALAQALGVEATAGLRFRFASIEGSTARMAPEVFAASDGPTLVLGRSFGTGTLRIVAEAVSGEGVVLAKRVVVVATSEGRLDARLADALRAYHRGRLAERVVRWAGQDAKRHAQAVAYAVDLGVVGPDVSAFAVPRDERGFMTRKDLDLYLTDGAPFDADDHGADFKPAPPGSVR